jgi:hypothetical protein
MLSNHPLRGRRAPVRRRAALAAAAAALTLAAAAPGAAHAGTYPMYACNVPGHETTSRGPWRIVPSLNGGNTRLAAVDTCASNGSFGVAQTGPFGMDPGSMAGIGLNRPGGYTVTQVKSYVASSLAATGSSASVLAEVDGLDYPKWSAPGNDNTVTPDVRAFSSGFTSFYWALYCASVASQRCDFANPMPLRIKGIEMTLSESAVPTVSFDGGTLTTAGAKKGSKSVDVVAVDGHSGVRKVEVMLDDTVLGSADHNSRIWGVPMQSQPAETCSYASWNACPLTQRETFTVDTTRVPDGAHSLTVRATDAAGNAKATTATEPVTVDNTAPAAPAATSATSVTTEADSAAITWSHPSGQTSPIVAAHVVVCGPNGCQDVTVPASGATGGATINRTDGYGTYTVRVGLEDAAGNYDPNQAKAYSVRFAPPASPPPPPVVVDPPTKDPVTPLPGPSGPAGPAGPAGATGAGGPVGATGAGAVIHLNGVNATASASMRATFIGSGTRSIRSAYGKKVAVTGQLLTPGGRPITGARVSVLMQDKMVGARMTPAGEVVSDADGRFRFVTTALRSRTIRFAYRAHLEDAAFAQTTDVSLGVVAKLSLSPSSRALRNGQSVVFRGTVAGAPRNARKVVELQVRKGSTWMTFRSTRLRNGRFSERYRFRRTRGRVTYVFRARVRQEAGFPFLTGHSKTVKVTVRG